MRLLQSGSVPFCLSFRAASIASISSITSANASLRRELMSSKRMPTSSFSSPPLAQIDALAWILGPLADNGERGIFVNRMPRGRPEFYTADSDGLEAQQIL